MKQVLQDLRRGRTLVEDVPAPLVRPGHVRIATTVSLISAGTERTLTEFARASLVCKALQQPERVKDAIQKARTDGLATTLTAIRARLEEPMAVGYCNVGRVLEVGADVDGLVVGDRVVSNGPHAGVVVVGKNLCARVPAGVDDDAAVFALPAAIALQGVRLAAPTLGEVFVVTGLGLIGLIAVQLLRANGCKVLGVDTDPTRLALARAHGAETADLSKGEDPESFAVAMSRGRGVDGVLLTLASKSSKPVAQAARMCRQRGRIVLVGVAGLELNRGDFYEKELSFQVSCSYGPGRHDPDYEARGNDYPFGLVRWTEQRNIEAALDLTADGRLNARPLISHRYPVAEAPMAYDLLASTRPSLGVLIDYPDELARAKVTTIVLSQTPRVAGKGVVGFIGAGVHGGRMLAKAFAEAGATLDTVVSRAGASAALLGRRLGFRAIASDPDAVLASPEIDTVCIATRHDSHAGYVRAALAAGKAVFVEKPLCLTLGELAEIETELARPGAPILMVGFNRRFAPMAVKARRLLETVAEPKALVITVNAGAIAADHWTQDPAVGGGRLVGEACHFIDLLRFLTASPVTGLRAAGLHRPGGPPRADIASITLSFADGSIGVINYLANGHKAHPKERLEVFCAGRVLVLDNYRRLDGHGWPGFAGMRAFRQDKGHRACVAAFVAAVKVGGPSPIDPAEILEVSRLAIEAADRAG